VRAGAQQPDSRRRGYAGLYLSGCEDLILSPERIKNAIEPTEAQTEIVSEKAEETAGTFEEATGTSSGDKAEKKGIKPSLIILICIIAVGGAAGAGYTIYRKKKNV